MSAASNYDNVLGQLQDFGLEVNHLEVGRLRRCNVAGSLNKTGWYVLNEFQTTQGELLLVGAYGDWREGADPSTGKPVSHSIKLDLKQVDPEERAAMKKRMAEDRRKAEAARKAKQERAARKATSVWLKLNNEGEHPYLQKKRVGSFGVKFSPSGNLAIPLMDVQARVHGLQIIYADTGTIKRKGRNKDFWPVGLAKRGHFHAIGPMNAPVILVAEGYATAASLHLATQHRQPAPSVVVAFDAGNLMPVAEAIHRKYPRARILICADDDFKTEGNPGHRSANAAALAVGGAWISPVFTARGERKLTDFNDLHVEESLDLVRVQLEAKLTELGWDEVPRVREASGQGGGDGRLRAITSFDEIQDRFVLIYGHKDTVFDNVERMLVPLQGVRNACAGREHVRRWEENPDKQIARVREVGFDPGEKDATISCNLWGGWPTSPKAGNCEHLLELLEYLCGNEINRREIFQWILGWLAYPIQNPGAKMRTSVVVHGGQGVGKNLFFEAIMAIYGEYGRIIDQAAIEDKFNDWASKKLFMIADEVVARAELFHVKNKLKSLITSDWIRINPKNVAAYEERNHVNLVFLSNETQPLILEKDDRRYCVIWTPPKLPPEIYTEVKQEIDAGGIEALHDYLLNLDLSEFSEYTPPPMTRAKADLIGISMDTTQRFWDDWIGGHLEPIPVAPCRSRDFYQLYKDYCLQSGYLRYAPEPKLLAEIVKRTDATKKNARYMNGHGQKQGMFIFPPGAESPPDKSQTTWLGECVDEFQMQYQQWKSDQRPQNDF